VDIPALTALLCGYLYRLIVATVTVDHVNRLTIIPGLRRLWRGTNEIQFGVDPARAIVIHLADPGHARFIDLLDGSRGESALLRDAKTIGIAAREAYELLAALQGAGLVISANTVLPDGMTAAGRSRLGVEASSIAIAGLGAPEHPTAAESIRRRSAASVLVSGETRLAVPIATTLGAAGIGHIDVRLTGRVTAADVAVGGLDPDDIGQPRATAAAAAVMRAAPDVDTRRLRDGSASFAIQVGQAAPPEVFALGLARRRLPHLLVEQRDGAILVGPLVAPTRSACVHCLHMHRRDRDDAWPALAAQLATGPDAPAASAMSTLLIATGIVAGQTLGFIDGIDVETLDASIEISPPVQIRRRSWEPHPQCSCAQSIRIRRPDATGRVSHVEPS
jgi:bacteriocin biosynthesis cyclodehydratase domain-containing protein